MVFINKSIKQQVILLGKMTIKLMFYWNEFFNSGDKFDKVGSA
ncbi:hypothetical protein UF75_2318 [Desulfosporosinus sp. I2]|nr:hypothetical protein UF75_2318 [Desulfosporosinus sp. I2]